ncbi:MAG: hypothetical protein A2571_00040 [Candidatus Vogelbacteria bacterium RIFOXYD1_FULL_44_32]|uniref:Uncharacterized protein n=1 Tax=Candidatus Vogelbacteria bacterium RIFOXYD1_FULL_44_32 TaxID=1802438 RepID=A0A1G2QE22_9BACT|nr:MAG: hypothetical protein A2571_00040 [Candidatus Vogelbacteria bacterium RIFOXYD1_FULL_44_32]
MRKLKIIGQIIVILFAGAGAFFIFGWIAVNLGLTNTPGIRGNRLNVDQPAPTQYGAGSSVWHEGEEWDSLETAIKKDAELINRVAQETNVPARAIVAQLVVEQLRLFHTERAAFKEILSPLRILGNQVLFSWGVMGMKEQTAIEIEKHLQNPDSLFYPGPKYEHLLDFKTTDHNKERFDRIANEKNHYYAYLYAGLYLKEVQTQWQKAGYDITSEIGIWSTLYNIGFVHSEPKPNPAVGGAAILIGDTTWSFGGLAQEFYESDKLLAEFPR